MICRQGPLDGCDIPDTGRDFFMFTWYCYGYKAGDCAVSYVYGRIGNEWHYQPNATNAANAAANREVAR